jgi:hypothetical protein
MLLNELLKEHSKNESQEATVADLKAEIAIPSATVKEQAAQIQKVNAFLEISKPAPQLVENVILLQGKTETNLDKTMDGKKLAAGNYVMSVVSEGKTASILVTIN